AIAPVDDLDRYCKAHDMCYEHLGHDSTACDQMLRTALDMDPATFEGASMLTRYSRRGVVGLGTRSRLNSADISDAEKIGLRCTNVAREMNLGVNLVKEGRLGEAREIANQAVFTMVDAVGFPEAAGRCRLDPHHRRQRDELASAVASAYADGRRCPRERNGRYSCMPTPAERVLGTGPAMTLTVEQILNPAFTPAPR
ncbi:MAG: hypothetical protein MI723_17665, partial [Caulobacterales bacterium]|nr:hypothetical protein [Caulobacterales bacterium]